MNRTFFLLVSLLLIAFYGNAQTDYSEYLNKAMEKLEAGDCDAAQRYYNVYRELTEKSVNSVEVLLADCKKELHLGDVIDVNGEQYIIAYLMENKLHGFAIRDVGVHSLANKQTLGYLENKMIPSLEEMQIIYKNNGSIGLTGSYWTRSVYGVSNGWDALYLQDFISGKVYYSSQTNKNGILLLHRF